MNRRIVVLLFVLFVVVLIFPFAGFSPELSMPTLLAQGATTTRATPTHAPSAAQALAQSPAQRAAQAAARGATQALDRSKTPPIGKTPELRVPTWTKSTLANGAELIVSEKHDLPLVSFSITFLGGADQFEPAGRRGLAGLAASMLSEGTKTRDAPPARTDRHRREM